MYSVLGRGEPARWHARRYFDFCESIDCNSFDRAFAHESMARAAALLGDSDACATHLERAREHSAEIEDADDRAYLLEELATISG